MPKSYRSLVLLAALGLGACAATPPPVQLAGPVEAIGRAPRAMPRLAGGRCDWPALDHPAVADLLMNATMGGPMVAATVYECPRRT
jgi:hypothetical protein